MKRSVVFTGIVSALILAGIAGSQEKPAAGSAAAESPGFLGIAVKYPGDEGIEQDPAVVFSENFEHKTVGMLDQDWSNILNPDYAVLKMVDDTTAPTPGKRCLQMTATKGHDTGGHLWKLLDEGYDKLYARFYCKFAEDAPYVHHFVHMQGRQDTIKKYPMGGAGSRPDGASNFSTSIDLIGSGSNGSILPPGAWSFYSYWCEMHSWQTEEGVPDGRANPYYGNLFGPIEPAQAKRGEWMCVEIMIKLNDPDERNGEEAFWINGKLIERYGPGTITGTWFRDMFRRSGIFNTDPQPFEGFRWRTSEYLKINIFWLEYYLAHVFESDYNPHDPDIAYNDSIARCTFDNVVLATEYIGPVAEAVEKPGCDYDGNGQSNVLDVVKLLQLCMSNPPDPIADYNGDGYCNVSDALKLLIDIIMGKC